MKKKSITLLPTSYFPSIHYLKVMNTHCVSLEAHENYQKRTIRNRTKILNANGPFLLSVPLTKGKTKSLITETKISFDEDWQIQHLKHIKSSYGSAPFYDHYIDEISELINNSSSTLWQLNLSILNYLKSLDYCQSWSFTESYVTGQTSEVLDYRMAVPSITEPKSYNQVFQEKFGFVDNLSCLDLLFNLGPEGASYCLT